MTASIDECCGILVNRLRQDGLIENTMLVFTSDHGEMFGAHGRMAKNIFYEEAVRVPFLVYWPGRVRGGLADTTCLGTPDIMPTLLAALGLDIPNGVEGIDFSGHLFGGPAPDSEHAFLQGMGHTWMWLDGFEWRGVRTRQFTYATRRIDREEFFFDNLSDPLQKRNLAKHPEHEREKERIKNVMLSKMADLKDEFRECSWYGRNWTENRLVLRGAKG